MDSVDKRPHPPDVDETRAAPLDVGWTLRPSRFFAVDIFWITYPQIFCAENEVNSRFLYVGFF